ncbi:hypothetical protein ScPMuIL_012612 [Solemya velum]
MADRYLGFQKSKARYSALGAGKHHDHENELLEAPEDDIDLLNDETFGDYDEDELDWEEVHERRAEALVVGDNRFETADYKLQEELFEQNISQLVIDEEEDFADPAIVNFGKNRPIPKRPQPTNLEDLYGPASPPSFLDTEHLVSPTSKNIWGSPALEAESPKDQPVTNLQSLFDFAKAASQANQFTEPNPVGPRPITLPKAQTLEEIEQQMLHNKPQVMIAEDLERQMRGQPHQIREPFSMPTPIPPIGSPASYPNYYQKTVPGSGAISHQMNGRQSPLQTLLANTSHLLDGRQSPLQTVMGGTPPSRSSGSPVFNSSRKSPYTRDLSTASPGARSGSPPTVQPSIPSVLDQTRMMSPYAQGVLLNMLGGMGTPNRALSKPIGIPQSASRGYPPLSPFNSPNGQRIPPVMPHSDPGHLRDHRDMRENRYHDRQYRVQNNHSEQRPNFRQHRDRYFNKYIRDPAGHDWDSRYRKDNRDRDYREKKKGDDYAGLMTQKEKDWIIKIQLLQLQTDNPFLDDYYYTIFTMKKKALERKQKQEGKGHDPKLVIPAMSRVEGRAYMPAQFEGSLGRLTSSSVHNPRPVINLLKKSMSVGHEEEEEEEKKRHVTKELRKSKQLLMDIENGYNLLLDADDIEKKILALPDDSRRPLIDERRNKVKQLYKYMCCEQNVDFFLQIMAVAKGRKLAARLLPLLEQNEAVTFVSLIIQNLQQLTRKNVQDEGMMVLFEPVVDVILRGDLAVLVVFAGDLQLDMPQSQSKQVAAAIQNKFGSSVICTLLHQAEMIYTKTSPVDMDNQLQTAWCHFVNSFAGILATVPSDAVIQPQFRHVSISDHLERLLNKRLIAAVEDKIKLFTDPKESIKS